MLEGRQVTINSYTNDIGVIKISTRDTNNANC